MHKTLALGKRIYRLGAQDALAKSELVGKDLHVVLTSGSVFFGTLTKTNHNCFVLENRTGKKTEFQISDIREVIYDLHSNY